MSATRVARRLGVLAVDAAIFALFAATLVMIGGGASAEPVLSGSMTGFADRGDLVVGTRGGTPRVGDVILFAPPAPYGTPGGRPVMHRVHTLSSHDGHLVATTKGDANGQPDPWTLNLMSTRTEQVRAVLPGAGWPFLRLRALATPGGRVAVGVAMMAVGAGVWLAQRRTRAPDPGGPSARTPGKRGWRVLLPVRLQT